MFNTLKLSILGILLFSNRAFATSELFQCLVNGDPNQVVFLDEVGLGDAHILNFYDEESETITDQFYYLVDNSLRFSWDTDAATNQTIVSYYSADFTGKAYEKPSETSVGKLDIEKGNGTYHNYLTNEIFNLSLCDYGAVPIQRDPNFRPKVIWPGPGNFTIKDGVLFKQ